MVSDITKFCVLVFVNLCILMLSKAIFSDKKYTLSIQTQKTQIGLSVLV